MAVTTSRVSSRTTGQTVLAVLALAYASFGWSLSPIFIRSLIGTYEPFSQILIRYSCAGAMLTVFCLTMYRAEFVRALKASKRIAPLALVLVLQQYCWTMGNYGGTATVAQMTSKLSVIFIVIFSFILFHEERGVIRNPFYILGTLLSLVGMAGILAKDPGSLVPTMDRYVVFLILTSLFWAMYVVWAKHLVGDIHPVALFTVLVFWAGFGFLVLTLLLGDIRDIVEAGPRMTAIAAASGLIPLALAHPAYHYAQRALGSALCSSLNLLNPLMTYGFALLIWPDERLLWSQWAGAAVLLAGTFLVTFAAHLAGRFVDSSTQKA